MSTHDTDRDYPVIDRARDDEPDDAGTTVLPVDPAYDGAAPDTPDTDRRPDTDADPDRFDDTADPDRVDDTTDTAGAGPDRFDDSTGADRFDDATGADRFGDSADTTDTTDTADSTDATDRADAEIAPVPMPLPADDATPPETAADDTADAGDELEDTWRELQVTFVDDPAAAVQGAAELLERAVAELRASLEGTDSTEDLRTAFRRYRDIFQTLR
jgi:hypothetical protein